MVKQYKSIILKDIILQIQHYVIYNIYKESEGRHDRFLIKMNTVRIISLFIIALFLL